MFSGMFGSIYSVEEDGDVYALVHQSEWDTDKFKEFVQSKKDKGYVVYQLGSKPYNQEIYINFTNHDIPDWFTSIL